MPVTELKTEDVKVEVDSDSIKNLLTKKITDFGKFEESKQHDLIEYYALVEILNDKNLEFNNKDNNHAAIVMANIFSHAKKTLKFFTGSFKGDICDQLIYLDALKKALDSKLSLEVIYEDEPNTNSECFKLLKSYKNQDCKISMFKLTPSYKKIISDLKIKLNHFLIGDDQMFRYEFDADAYKAYCNFDDKKSVDQLAKNFDIIKNNSIAYQ